MTVLAIDSSRVKALPGGRIWSRTDLSAVTLWDSNCENFRIAVSEGGYTLYAFAHDMDSGDVYHKRFGSLEEAMQHAEELETK